MMFRRWMQGAVAAAVVMTPLMALAQNGAFVTVAPLGTPAPVLGVPQLSLLALTLAVVAFLVLRRRSAVVSGG